MKLTEKYNYIRSPSNTTHGSRTYEVGGLHLPSVTTVLAKTKDQTYLTRWRKKVGQEEAERIFNLASKRGTAMHKFLENHIKGTGYDDLTEIGIEAKAMANKIIQDALPPITEYYGSEITVHYTGLYAGSTDLVCLHNDMETIVDFKQSNKPKKQEWVEDYCLQIAAYAMAHDYIYGSNIRQGVIMVCTPDLYLQEFRFQDAEMREWRHKFLARLDAYYELQHDEKEQTNINNTDLLRQFEKDQ